ncbi:hypothetical protein D3C85_871790 [compost metagenome]
MNSPLNLLLSFERHSLKRTIRTSLIGARTKPVNSEDLAQPAVVIIDLLGLFGASVSPASATLGDHENLRIPINRILNGRDRLRLNGEHLKWRPTDAAAAVIEAFASQKVMPGSGADEPGPVVEAVGRLQQAQQVVILNVLAVFGLDNRLQVLNFVGDHVDRDGNA